MRQALSLNLGGGTTINTLSSGWYYTSVTDGNGCFVEDSLFDFTITYPDSLYFVELGTDPAYCRMFGYQSGNGVVYAAAAGGTPDYDYEWTYLLTGQTSTSTTWGGRNPGQYQIVATDDNGCTLTAIVTLDSLNPLADFEMTSPQFTSDYFGTAPVDVHFVNQSMYFANPNDPNADTTFFWNFNAPSGDWILSTDVFETFDSTYLSSGEFNVCLVALNKNGCSDTLCKPLIIYDPLAFVPVNVFTPDGDNANNTFTFIHYSQAVAEFSCIIVNRWGVKVFEMSAITDEWENGQKW
ncbi:MAG: gliding motility-associated C-terminal domain-containing protein [Crocinitomicaceae bacterium]|nr:gliding motility-associated C-terminal domain-containing protein [Crocinitomicaceae bacterium]